MTWFKILLLYFAIFTFDQAQCFPYGAPTEACYTMKPGHIFPPQPGPSPFAIDPAQEFQNGSLDLILKAQCGNTFEGYLLMAFDNSSTDDQNPLGSFTKDSFGLSQYLGCGNPQSALTHTSPKEKNSVNVKWTPPLGFQGFVVFKASFVKSFGEYWVKERSSVVEVKQIEYLSTASPVTHYPLQTEATEFPFIALSESLTTEKPINKRNAPFTEEPGTDEHLH